jgi:signal transduction histidine kinase
MPVIPDVEQRRTRAWTVAGIIVVAITLVLAGLGMILALRQTGSLAYTRIADRRLEARAIKESIIEQTDKELDELLRRFDERIGAYPFANRLGSLDGPAWVNQLCAFYKEVNNEPGLIIWRPGENGEWVNVRRVSTVERKDLMSRLMAPWFAVATGPMTNTVQYVFDIDENGPMVLPYITRGPQNDPLVLAAGVDLAAYQKTLIEPRIPQERFTVRKVLPEQAADVRRASAWEEDLSPVAPHLWIAPAASFVNQQHALVRRQTVLVVTGTLLAMAALLGVMWSMWRVFQRELALSRMQQAFVADVSHELKTPLALIRLFAETLKSGRVPTEEKRQDYYTIIARESDRLTHMINNILDFSRIDAGKKRYVFQETDLASLVRETYEAYRVQLDHEGFEHQLVIGEDLPTVACDRDAIAQALINLVNNAMKYTDGEDKFLGIDVSRETRRGAHGVLISVSDRGIGIRPEDRNQLFSGFYRSSDERVRQKRGAGLGLALVKHIVDNHGGIVDVESRLVKGSIFRIFLPASPQAALAEDADHASPNPDRGR